MNRFWFCLTALLAASSSLDGANEVNEVLDSELKSWSRLKREAGYYTESGQWRGGFYKKARTTETEHYRCLSHTDTHCTSWCVSERRRWKHETGDCSCAVTASPFCERWTCNTRFEYSCGDSEHSVTCIAKEELNCDCEEPARNERYCWKWRCREDSNTKTGGYHEDEVYECVVEDVSEEFCFSWHGNTTSKYQLESTACQCFERGRSFCKHWICRERGMNRCEQSGRGWCRLEIAIGVGGGAGLFLFVFCLMRSTESISKRSMTSAIMQVVGYFAILCLPWFVGVVIWGGIFGIPWVLPMWSLALVLVICATVRAKCKRNGQGVELSRIQLPEIQVPVAVTKTTKSIDDSQSDRANDV